MNLPSLWLFEAQIRITVNGIQEISVVLEGQRQEGISPFSPVHRCSSWTSFHPILAQCAWWLFVRLVLIWDKHQCCHWQERSGAGKCPIPSWSGYKDPLLRGVPIWSHLVLVGLLMALPSGHSSLAPFPTRWRTARAGFFLHVVSSSLHRYQCQPLLALTVFPKHIYSTI